MVAAIAENLVIANQFKERQLKTGAWFHSLERANITAEGKEELPGLMRAHLDEIVNQIPGKLAIFGEGAANFPKGLGLKITEQSKVSEGAWDLTIVGRDPDGGDKSANFRLQWSGEFAGRYHLFVLSSRGESGVIPTIFDETSVARELAIYTIGRQIAGTPLSRNYN